MTQRTCSTMRDYHAEIVEATLAGDIKKLAALAHECAGMAQEAARLEIVERERKAHHAEWKRNNRRIRQETSMDVHGQSRTDMDTVDNGSPLAPPPPLPAPNLSSPLNPPSTPRAERSVRGKRAKSGTRNASWLAHIAPKWEAKFGAGTFPYGKAGAALKPLVEAGHATETIADYLGRYLDDTERQYVSLHRFAETFDAYKPFAFTGPPIVGGWMSDELERLTRPDGYVPWTGKVA